MTDREKVIKGLECCVKHDEDFKTSPCSSLDCPYLDDCAFKNYFVKTSLMRDALELLKEQEPVKPRFADGVHYTVNKYLCGACGHHINQNSRYCEGCGRAVKWDD